MYIHLLLAHTRAQNALKIYNTKFFIPYPSRSPFPTCKASWLLDSHLSYGVCLPLFLYPCILPYHRVTLGQVPASCTAGTVHFGNRLNIKRARIFHVAWLAACRLSMGVYMRLYSSHTGGGTFFVGMIKQWSACRVVLFLRG